MHGLRVDPSASRERPQQEDPIAVVGLSLRFPGDGESPETFWDMLCEGRCAMTEFPPDRFNVDSFHNKRGHSSTMPLRGGHFLKQSLSAFDAPFFSITPAEAAAMDPQHRILLETTYHALENAGISLGDSDSNKTSVFTATFTDDYRSILLANPDRFPKYAATGLSSAMLANRISWFFNFKGASMNLDSACSSSLSALHLACQGLINGDSNTAIVGGCNLVFHPDILLTMSNMSFLSPDSRCWSFDDRANGYARGDGFGVLVLKKLSNALAEGLNIRAVIRATGLNQDGRTNGGITQPSGEAQKALINDTFARSNLDMSLVRYFEAHGTGTAIGDPIEASAIGECFRSYRSEENPLIIGAVKSSIGHLEGGSGVAGVIKTIFILEKGIIPPNAGFERANPKINTQNLRIKFPTTLMEWPSHGLRRACVNSFGFGGSNAFVVLDDALNYLRSQARINNHLPQANNTSQLCESTVVSSDTAHRRQGVDDKLRPRVLVWSAADAESAKRMVLQYRDYFNSRKQDITDFCLDQIAYTLSERRSLLSWRTCAVVTRKELGSFDQVFSKPVRSRKTSTSLAFVFTGQGAQYHSMGAGLKKFPVFLESLVQSEKILTDLGCGWSLQALLGKSDPRINSPEFSQTCTTALQIALVDLLKEFGVVPAAVVGHSSGEIGAAYCAGLLSKKTALAVAYHRGVLAGTVAEKGVEQQGMLAVALSEENVRPFLNRLKEHFWNIQVQIGCLNSLNSVTLTGNREQLKLVAGWLEDLQHRSRMLRVDISYHSDYMLPIKDAYFASLKPLDWRPCTTHPLPIISSVTGNVVASATVRDPMYWCTNLISQVKFHQAMSFLCFNSDQKPRKQLTSKPQTLNDITDFLEIGPHSTLQGPILDIIAESGMKSRLAYSSALNRFESADKYVLAMIGELWARGQQVDLLKVNGIEDDAKIICGDLPAYPFNHSQQYWFEDRASTAFRFRQQRPHELLGSWIPTSSKLEPRWRSFINTERLSWLQDHQINGDCLVPGAGMIGMVIEAVKQLVPQHARITKVDIRSVKFKRALQLPENGEDIETHVNLSTDQENEDESWHKFRVFSFDPDCIEHCCGYIQLGFNTIQQSVCKQESGDTNAAYLEELSELTINCNSEIDSQSLYQSIKKDGVSYGPCFRTLTNIRFHGNGSAVASLSLPNLEGRYSSHYIDTAAYVIHPSLLDGLFQLVFPALNQGGKKDLPTMVPSFVRKLVLFPDEYTQLPSQDLYAGTSASFNGYRGTESKVIVKASDNRVSAVMEGYQTTFVSVGYNEDITVKQRLLLSHMIWQPDVNTLSADQMTKLCGQGRAPGHSIRSFYRNILRLIDYYLNELLTKQTESQALSQSFKFPNDFKFIKKRPLPKDGECWPGLQTFEQPLRHEDDISVMEQQIINTSSIGEYYVRLGHDLATSVTDPSLGSMALSSGLVNAYFGDASDRFGLLKPLHTWLTAAYHKNPSMRVLEIGNLDGLPFNPSIGTLDVVALHNYHYEYALNSSEMLLETENLLNQSGFKYPGRVLDIEKEPALPVVDEPQYDVVVALHVLIERGNLEGVLRNIKRLLKADGKLVLFGYARPHLRSNLLQGILSATVQNDVSTKKAPSNTHRSQAHVSDILLEAGFSGVDVEIRDTEDETLHELSMFVSTTVEKEELSGPLIPPVTLFIKSGSPMQLSFAQMLQERLLKVGIKECSVCVFETCNLTESIAERLCISLLEYGEPFLHSITSDNFEQLKFTLARTRNVLWIVKKSSEFPEPSFHMVDGLARCLRSEDTNLRFVRLTLDAESTSLDTITCSVTNMLRPRLDDMEPEIQQINGSMHINRVVQSPSMNTLIASKQAPYKEEIVKLYENMDLAATFKSPGLLNSLTFDKIEAVKDPCLSDEIIVNIHAVGLSTRDFQVASGQLNDNRIFAHAAGLVTQAGSETDFRPGDKVLVHCPGSCRTALRCKAMYAVKLLSTQNVLEAVGFSMPSLTAFHALVDVAELTEGETVLIHHASRCTGQIAIQVAQSIGASVIATVETSEEFSSLHERYSLPSTHILHTDSSDLSQSILRATNYQGVDVILNWETKAEFEGSLEVVAPFGRLIDTSVGKERFQITLSPETNSKCVRYSSVDLMQIQSHRPSIIQNLLTKASSWLHNGKYSYASSLAIYDATSIVQALQSFSSGEPIEPVVIDLSPNQTVKARIPNGSPYRFDENSTYVVAGGFGGLGRSIIHWMVRRGARHLLILSRSGPSNSSAQKLLEELAPFGVQVQAPRCDIASPDSLQSALVECNLSMPPVRGCIQATMVLRDAIFANMTHDDFITSIKPKTLGSWNLHSLLPKGLDFFIQLSSVGGILGASSQSNYAAGNTFEDALARFRVTQGEKAVSIDLGMMVSEGVVAETAGMLDSLRRLGYLMDISSEDFFALLDHYCDPSLPILPVDESQVVVGIEHPAAIEAKGIDVPVWMHRPLFRHFHRLGASGTSSAKQDVVDNESVLRSAADIEQAAEHIAEWLGIKLAQVLGIPVEEIDHQRPIRTIGLNSLAAVEMKTWFSRQIGAEVAVFEILGNMTMAELCKHAAEKTSFR